MWTWPPLHIRRECLDLETRALYIKLAFGVLDLENFKSAFLRSLDANMTNSASQTRVRQTLHLEVTLGSFKTRVRVFDLCLASHVSDASLISDCVWIHILLSLRL